MIRLLTLLVFSIGASAALSASLPLPIQLDSEDITWVDGPANLPPGTKIAVLEGDPKKEGMFTMRVRLPKDAVIQPHTHPRDERVTVLLGSVRVGFGDVFDKKQGRRFKLGAFYINPADSHHYVWTDGPAILQITGQGPWELHYLK